MTEYGSIANDSGSVRRLVQKLGQGAELISAYEAGPTGYPLHRQLVQLGVRSGCGTGKWGVMEPSSDLW